MNNSEKLEVAQLLKQANKLQSLKQLLLGNAAGAYLVKTQMGNPSWREAYQTAKRINMVPNIMAKADLKSMVPSKVRRGWGRYLDLMQGTDDMMSGRYFNRRTREQKDHLGYMKDEIMGYLKGDKMGIYDSGQGPVLGRKAVSMNPNSPNFGLVDLEVSVPTGISKLKKMLGGAERKIITERESLRGDLDRHIGKLEDFIASGPENVSQWRKTMATRAGTGAAGGFGLSQLLQGNDDEV